MKKFLSLIMALLVVFSLATASFAVTEDIGLDLGDHRGPDVAGFYDGDADASTRYHLDVTWGSFHYTYFAVEGSAWDPESHILLTDIPAESWLAEANSGTLMLTNHSNAAVDATVVFTMGDIDGMDDVTHAFSEVANSARYATFDDQSATITLEDASEVSLNEPDNAPTIEVEMTLSGVPENEDLNKTQIGTIRVTLQGASPDND